ncbi:putative ARM-like repeat-containing protein [Lachnellula occidentalis]|uniref:Putative ARM-like repeat-containing protein n=1 Tax=Lachnellula occidentalis TaxID=215460 RepID=A0A8H8RI48_9HELO|nr:putative ARM-like repeat-containing protein [Lachnellula occidentalis]
MGKSKPRIRQKNRADPTGKTKPPSDPELASIRESRILPVLKDLQSPDLKARSAAAIAIANLIEDTKCRKLLLREQIVKILLEQTLTDSSLDTRTAGWGILRNLALEEEADFCIHLYRQDVLTSIQGIVKTIIQTVESQDPPFSKLPGPQQTLVWTLTSSAIGLLSSLSEAQDEIVEAISKISTIPNFLFGLLSFEPTPSEVQNEVLSCLATLLEDNKPLAELVVENGDWLQRLMQIKDSGATTNVSACGVLHNIFTAMEWTDYKTPIEGASDATLIPTLVHTLENTTPSSNGTNGTNGNTTNSSPDQVLQLALEIIASISTSLQEALEHGHKHDFKNEEKFEGFEDEPVDDEMDADIDDAGSVDKEEDGDAPDSEMSMSEIEADMELVTGDASENEDSHIEEPTLSLLIRSATPAILPLAHPSQSENSNIHSCALSALNNIAWTISSIDFSSGHLNSLKKSWSALAQRTWSEIISPVLASNTADIELASAITSLAWAVSRSVGGEITLRADEHRKFMALYHASKSLVPEPEDSNGAAKKGEEEEDAFQSLGVKSLGVLGSLALSPCPVPLNREIGIFLLTTLSSLPNIPAADAVEALNAIMDIYADKSYEFDEEVFWKDGFHKHLDDCLPGARKLAKGVDKRRFGELRARVDEVVLNLVRFLKYKKTERGRKD